MNEVDDHDDALHDLLHDRVSSVYASPDLADRVETAARRRRTARWSVTGAIALIAIGVTIGTLAAVRPGATAASATARLPTCPQHSGAEALKALNLVATPTSQSTVPMPGHPDAAVLCRYVGDNLLPSSGDLVGSATVTDRTRLDQLQRVTNAGRAIPRGDLPSCAIDEYGDLALVYIAYPGATVRVIGYQPFCAAFVTDHREYWANGGFGQLLTQWTGVWQH